MSQPSSRPALLESIEPPPRSTRLGRIKGFAFSEFANWYADNHGRGRISRALEAAELKFHVDFDRDRGGFGILASHWYDADVVHAVLDAIVERHAPEELEVMARDAADAIMGKMLSGIYRAAFSVCVTPARYLRHVDKVWRLQYDNGEPVIVATGETEHTIHYRGWRSHHPMICRLNMASARPIYAAMGCKETRYTRIACVSEGAARCQAVVVWE